MGQNNGKSPVYMITISHAATLLKRLWTQALKALYWKSWGVVSAFFKKTLFFHGEVPPKK